MSEKVFQCILLRLVSPGLRWLNLATTNVNVAISTPATPLVSPAQASANPSCKIKRSSTIIHYRTTCIRVESWLRWLPTPPNPPAAQGIVATLSVMAISSSVGGCFVVRTGFGSDIRARSGDTSRNRHDSVTCFFKAGGRQF